ncbi:MAG: hypothetical protein JXA09_05260 [Anaerolineae bacterium]|nr:hypothetical protein [Anaerolineae bacterium]
MPVDLNDTYDALYRRALAYIGIGDIENALETLWRIVRRLVQLRPETLQRREALQYTLEAAWLRLVRFLEWEKRYDEAIAACEMVRMHIPDLRASRRIAALRIERGEIKEGLAQMREAVDAQPNAFAWIDLATAYLELERYKEAERCCQSALEVAQSNDEAVLANLSLFGLYKQTDRVSEALDAWSMAIVLEPELVTEVSDVYAWLIERGDLAQAERYLSREPNTLRRTFYRGVLHWAAGRENDATAQWERVLTMDVHAEGADVEAWLEAALRVGEPQRVLEYESEIPRGGPSLAISSALMMVAAHSLLGHDEEVQTWLAEIVRHLDRGWPTLGSIDERRMQFLRSLVTQPQVLEVLDRIAKKD